MGNAITMGGVLGALARLAGSLLCAALLAGCNMLSVGYGHIDTYAAWTADEYFGLDAQQKQDFRARFDRLHEWHRTEQLPDYAAFLGSTNSRIRKGLAQEDVQWVTQGIEDRYRTLVKRGADDAAAMLMTITPEQLENLKKQWGKDNSRYRREYRVNGNPAEQREARIERELKRIREWAGDLNAEQEKKIAALVDDLPLAPKLRYEDRLRRQQEFLQLMAQRGTDKARFTERLRTWLLNWEDGRSPEFVKFSNEWRRKQADFYVGVEKTLNSQQRSQVVRRVQNFAEDFTQLAQR